MYANHKKHLATSVLHLLTILSDTHRICALYAGYTVIARWSLFEFWSVWEQFVNLLISAKAEIEAAQTRYYLVGAPLKKCVCCACTSVSGGAALPSF